MSQRLSFEEEWEQYFEWESERARNEGREWFRNFVRLHRHSSKYWICVLLGIWEGALMARGKGNGKASGGAGGDVWTTFVDIRVGAEDVEALHAAQWTADDVYDKVTTVLEQGYRLSFSYNRQNDSTIASLTCKAEGNVNEGKTLTAFHQGWYDALRLVLWKHEGIAEMDWSRAAKERGGSVFG